METKAMGLAKETQAAGRLAGMVKAVVAVVVAVLAVVAVVAVAVAAVVAMQRG